MVKKSLIVVGVLVAVGSYAWFVPCRLEATYIGSKPYQYETIEKIDLSVQTSSLLGNKKKITDFQIGNEKLIKTDQDITISSGYFSTKLPIEAVGLKKILWDYPDTVYIGDQFRTDELTAEAEYVDGKKIQITDLNVEKAPDIVTENNTEVLTDSFCGSQTYTIPVHLVKEFSISSKGTLYADTYPSDDLLYTAEYDDGTTRDISVDDMQVAKEITLNKGKNTIPVTYLGKKYDVSVKAKEKTAAVLATEKYQGEIDESEKTITEDSIFVTSRFLHTKTGSYYLTHIVVNDPSQIFGGLSYDSFGGKREAPSSYCKRKKLAVVTNGSYFSYDTGQPACAGLFIKNGKIVKDGVTNGSEVCLDNSGRFFTPAAGISATELLKQGVKDVFGTADPLLIQDGKKVDLASQHKINAYYYNRTGIGMVSPGEYYIITAGTKQYRNGLSFTEMQSIFSDLGCSFARSLDGGGSSSLIIQDTLRNIPAQISERPVVDFLCFSY